MQSDVTATTHKQKKPPKKINYIEIHPAKNGGHTARHVFTHYDHPAEEHVFGEGEGGKLMAHLKEHLGIADENSGGAEAADQDEKEEATA